MRHFYVRRLSGLSALSAALIWIALPTSGSTQSFAAPQTTVSAISNDVLLWPAGAPGTLGDEPQDKPRITVFALPATRSGSHPEAPRAAFLILPGGAYVGLANDHEGKQIGKWLNDRGIVAFMLTYRLSPRYHYPAPFQDASRSMRYIRAHAADYDIDPARIGVWGFSAGGHLASLLGTEFDVGDPASPDPVERVSSRPDLMVLAYPVIEQYGHAAAFSYESLLGKTPDSALIEKMKTDLHVTAATPPTFLFHTDSDDAVSSLNSVLFYLALKRAGVPAEMHIYAQGPHGVGLAESDPILRTWPQRLEDWLKLRGYLSPPPDASDSNAAARRK
jgi:acetyl esterase/lipase